MPQITANVWVETGRRGCNYGFVTTGEGVVMIDTPYKPSDALLWREEIAPRGPVRYILNTEAHGDHVTGNAFFPGTVVAHQGIREAMLPMSLEQLRERIQQIDPPGLPLLEGYRFKLPAITFHQGLSLYLGDQAFHLLHLPGHTPSETGVYIPQERVVFTGDNVFCRVQSFLHEALPDQWLQSLDRIGQLDVEAIVPGHGQVCTKDYLQEQAAFIREWVAAVQGAIGRGWSKEQALEGISFLSRYPMDVGLEAMGPEVQRWNVSRLYDLLSQRARP